MRYEVARNHMPDAFVDDLDRWSKTDPATSTKEYVRWQRGPLTETPMALMKSWIDTTATHDNIWLVLVFHGVDGVGWKPKTNAELKEYFSYIKSKEDQLWVATFQDATKYMRERIHSHATAYQNEDGISVVLRSDLTNVSYDLPLTLKTNVPPEWKAVEVRQGHRTSHAIVNRDRNASYALYQAVPNAEVITLSSETAR